MLADDLCGTCYRARRRSNPELLERERQRARIADKARYHAGGAYERHRRVLARYGLTVAQWDAMLINQQGRCAACAVPLLAPQVDHCHSSGKIRSLLCGNCNSALGHVKDDVERLRGLIDYLISAA